MPKLLGLRLLLRLPLSGPPLERLKELGEACEVEEGEDAQRLQRLRLLLSREDAGLEEAAVADEHKHDLRQAHVKPDFLRHPCTNSCCELSLWKICCELHVRHWLVVMSFLVYEVTSFL